MARSRGGNPRIYLTADAKGVERGTKQAEGYLGTLSKKGTGHFRDLAKGAAAAATAYLGISEAKSAIGTTEELAKATLSLNRNFGLSIKQSSEWAAVAKTRGIDNKQLSQSFGVLSKNVEAATHGSKAQAKAFAELGISKKALESGDLNQVLGEAADKLGLMEGGTKRTALGMKLFGRGWQTVLPLLKDGSKGLNDQLALADKYGATFGNKTVGDMKKFIASQREAKLAGLGLQIAFGTKVAPVLTKGIEGLSSFVKGMHDGTGAGGKFADEAHHIAHELEPVLHTLEDIGKWVADHPQMLELALGGAGLYKVGSKLVKPASFVAKVAAGATGRGGLVAGGRPIPVYVVNGPNGMLPGKGGGPIVAPPGGLRGNPIVRGVGGIAGGVVVGAGISKALSDAIGGGNGPTAGLLMRAIGGQAKTGSEAVKKFNDEVHRLAARGDTPGLHALADKIRELANRNQDLIKEDKLLQVARHIDTLGDTARGASKNVRDAADANYGLGRSQRAALQNADELAAKIRKIERAGGDASDEYRRLARSIRDLPQKARIDIIASVSETFRIQHHGSSTQTTHRRDGTTFSSSPGAATGAFLAGPRGAGDIVPLWGKPGEVVLTEEMQDAIGRQRIFSVMGAMGARVIGPGGRASGGGVLSKMVSAANTIDAKHYPYLWGGGHNSSFRGPYDCSGAVSAILHAGGVLGAARVSGDFESYGDPGPGTVTLFANSGHVYMRLGKSYFGTSGSNPRGGAGWFPGAPRAGFVVRHVPESLLGKNAKKIATKKTAKNATGTITGATGGIGTLGGDIAGAIGGTSYVPGPGGIANTAPPDSGGGDTSASDTPEPPAFDTTADLQAQLDKVNAQNQVIQRDLDLANAFINTAGGSGDIGSGGPNALTAAGGRWGPVVHVNVKALIPTADPRTLRTIGDAAAAALGYQGSRSSKRLDLGI